VASEGVWLLSDRVADTKGIETVHLIRKGRVRWLAKGDAVGQGLFIAWLFGLAA